MTLDRVGITLVLNKLARKPGRARELYTRLMGSWGQRPDRDRVTVKLGEQDLKELESLNLRNGILGRDVLPSGWLAVYRSPKQPHLEVTVQTKDRPPKRRTFRTGGKRRQLVRVSAKRITNNHHEEATLATTKTRKRKPAQEEELEELEGLEDLEDLDDEDLEDEEPEDEDDEGDEEDEEPAPKRGRAKKPAAKKAPAKKTSKRRPEPDEDEDEDDEEDEEPAPRKRGAAKSKTTASKTTSKSKAAAKSSTKKAGNNLPTTRELPKGQVGPTDIAEMVGDDCDARYVRIFLRDNYERPEGGRWAFGKQDARSIAKEIKAHRKHTG